MTDHLDPAAWALRYADADLHVLPLHGIRGGGCTCRRPDCHSPGKHPLVEHGKDDATCDPEQITRGGTGGRAPTSASGHRSG